MGSRSKISKSFLQALKKFQESNPTWRVFNDAGEISSGYRVPFDDIDWKDRIGDYLSRDMKSEIEADPMSYVNAKDRILRDYANKVITGEQSPNYYTVTTVYPKDEKVRQRVCHDRYNEPGKLDCREWSARMLNGELVHGYQYKDVELDFRNFNGKTLERKPNKDQWKFYDRSNIDSYRNLRKARYEKRHRPSEDPYRVEFVKGKPKPTPFMTEAMNSLATKSVQPDVENFNALQSDYTKRIEELENILKQLKEERSLYQTTGQEVINDKFQRRLESTPTPTVNSKHMRKRR